jgi:hypothetical protein
MYMPDVDARGESRLSWAALVIVLAGLAGAALASGATGLWGKPLQRGMTWLAIAAALLACRICWRPRRLVAAVAVVALAVAMTAWPLVTANVLGVALLLAMLAATQEGVDRRAIASAALAAAVLGIWRFACTSIPTLWLGADALGGVLGRLGALLAGRELWVGATFGGVDFLVLSGTFLVGWLIGSRRPRRRRILLAVPAVLAGHMLYLAALALLSDYRPEGESESAQLLRTMLPWSLPVLAGLVHLVAVGAVLVCTRGSAAPQRPRRPLRAVTGVAWVLAVLLPVAVVLPIGPACSLAGKKIVAYEKGYLNWEVPKHGSYGHYSIGMYGMLPTYVAALGGECVISPDLSEEDLRDADVLVLLFPDDPWAPGQLDRIERFVRRGGSLLVMGEHTTEEEEGGSRFNDVLTLTEMHVRFDSATFAVGGWLQSYEALAHPTTAGLAGDRNAFGVVIGATVRTHWPARPLLVGRWGWADPGDVTSGAAMMGNHRYDGGEKLGDLVLASEQSVGEGTVVAFGDTSSMTNGIMIGAHPFTSRLLGYLASRPGSGQALWRQSVGLLCAAAMVVLLALRAGPVRVAVATVLLGASLAVCTEIARRRSEILPDGRIQSPNNLAYIDTGHLGAHSEESWRPSGLMGLKMTLMRNGFLTLDMDELTSERLRRAGLLVSVAPSRSFSPSECAAVREFVEKGGIFILTVGYDQRHGSESILREFGFRIGTSNDKTVDTPGEPQPRGHFKSPYLDMREYMTYVRYDAAWPVACDAPAEELRAFAYCPGNVPAILQRRVGEGKVIVVGDTGFAMNKNLEREGGQPFEGMRENADFWRWFLTVLRNQPAWIPPQQKPPSAPAGGEGGE